MVFTPVPNWDQIAQTNIFPGESGGDYNALFGYSNRPGGRWAHVQPTRMTLGEMMQFTDPSGEYAQWVKGQIGRVATPTGAYQVVGTTMRDAARAMGLDPNMPYDKRTQDMIGQWIYQNQGPQAWEAWGKAGGNAVPYGGPLEYMAGDANFPLFDPGPTKGDRFRAGMVAAGEAFGALGAGHAPTFEATDAWLRGEAARRATNQAARGQYGANVRASAQSQAAQNATASWLETQGEKGKALAGAIRSGAMSGEDAIAALTDPDAVIPSAAGAGGAPLLTEDQLGNINTLRDDVRTDLAPFYETNNAAQNIFAAAQQPGGAGDFVIAQQFAKLLDPTSVVREGELAAVQSVGGSLAYWLERGKGEIEMSGGSMGPETKRQILNLTEQIVKVRRESAQMKLETYRRLATDAGIDPSYIVGLDDLATLPPAPVIPGAATITPEVSPLLSPTPTPGGAGATGGSRYPQGGLR